MEVLHSQPSRIFKIENWLTKNEENYIRSNQHMYYIILKFGKKRRLEKNILNYSFQNLMSKVRVSYLSKMTSEQ